MELTKVHTHPAECINRLNNEGRRFHSPFFAVHVNVDSVPVLDETLAHALASYCLRLFSITISGHVCPLMMMVMMVNDGDGDDEDDDYGDGDDDDNAGGAVDDE